MRTFRGVAVLLAFVVVGCGGGGSDAPTENNNPTNNNPGGTNPGGSNPGPSTSKNIAVLDGAFDPSATTVPLNSTVTWTWATQITHNVTFSNASLGTSGDKSSGSFAKTFPNVGAFAYHCTIHPGMEGTVTVQ
jgi:plastocyanin